jgi:ABC-type lipoprotein release transport system permease subunit
MFEREGMHLQMAWRNIWRNSRRTAVILTAIVVGVWSMVFLGALMRGMSVSVIQNGLETLTGDVQIHATGYRADPVVDNRIENPDEPYGVLTETLPPGSLWTSRVRVSAVASNARHTTGVTLVGVDPLKEPQMSFIGQDALLEGRFLEPGELNAVVVGRALMKKYETRVGNKLILMAQGTSGDVESRAFRISGVYRAEMEETEKRFVFVPRAAAQDMLGMGDAVSEIEIKLPDHEESEIVAATLAKSLPDSYEINSWEDLLPMQVAFLRIFDGFMVIWNIVVFIAMAFGIVNTILMAVFERIREFGLMRALGMKPGAVIREVMTEALLLLAVGCALGNLVGMASVALLARTGIDLSSFSAGMEYAGMSRIIYPVLTAHDLALANAVVGVLGLLVSLYPAVRASRFTPVEAMART